MKGADDKKPLVGPYLNLGMQLAIAELLGFAVGYFADIKLNTRPLFLIIGVIFGAMAGFLNIYRTVYPDKSKK